MDYRLLADLVLVLHFCFVAFNVLGLVLIFAGRLLAWAFVANRWFRGAHLAAMGVVVLEALTGTLCPLTFWENVLRELSGQAGPASESFVGYWVGRLLFYDWDEQTFTILYALFFTAMLSALFWAPVDWQGRKKRQELPSGKSKYFE
ncbi:MAG: DUF2784 domain-containing protein [Desulfovibrionaceae bacterium]